MRKVPYLTRVLCLPTVVKWYSAPYDDSDYDYDYDYNLLELGWDVPYIHYKSTDSTLFSVGRVGR